MFYAAVCTAASFFSAPSRYRACLTLKSLVRLLRISSGHSTPPLSLRQEVARQLGLRFIFVEKEDGKLVLRRGFKIATGEKCLIVEDVVTQGGRVRETLAIVREHGGIAAGVAMVVDRSNGTVDLGVPTFSLLALKVETFPADQLPPDLAASQATKPGSK